VRNATFARLAALVLTISLGSFACASNGDAPTEGEMTTATETAAQEAEPMNTGEILHVLQTINDGEINHAQLAVQKSDNPEVQQTAQTIIQDHRDLNERIDTIARDTGAEMTETDLSRTIETQVSQIQDQLTELSGQEFDQEFLRRQIQLHELSIMTARDELMPSATEPQVRDLLTDASDHLEQHLEVAQRNYEQIQEEAIGGGPNEQDMDEQDMDEQDMDEQDMDEQDMEDDWADPDRDE
jgi:predicted outer membrane protein